MSSIQIITLMCIHGLFDWYLQDRETAENKSSNIRYLIPHLFILLIGLLIWGSAFGELTSKQTCLWALTNVIVHGIIDWNLITLYKLYVINRFKDADGTFKYWKDKGWFDFIMLDQLLHGLCYVMLYDIIR